MAFQISAIVILLVFYGCYFFKMTLQSRKSIKTNQMGKGKHGTEKTIEIILQIASVLVPVVELFSIFKNTSAFPNVLRILGVFTAVLGDAVFVAAVLTMKDSWRVGVSKSEKTELITSGIYGISRNPAFVGFHLVYIGILIMFFNTILAIVSIAAMIMFHLQIVYVEEKFLIEAFGEEYLRYKDSVNRYFGKNR